MTHCYTKLTLGLLSYIHYQSAYAIKFYHGLCSALGFCIKKGVYYLVGGHHYPVQLAKINNLSSRIPTESFSFNPQLEVHLGVRLLIF